MHIYVYVYIYLTDYFMEFIVYTNVHVYIYIFLLWRFNKIQIFTNKQWPLRRDISLINFYFLYASMRKRIPNKLYKHIFGSVSIEMFADILTICANGYACNEIICKHIYVHRTQTYFKNKWIFLKGIHQTILSFSLPFSLSL